MKSDQDIDVRAREQEPRSLLNIFGGYLENHSLDDLEVEAFEEDAVLMITFHQAKGLEFDHIYVAGTGRQQDMSPALRTRLFSGDAVPYSIITGTATTKDIPTLMLADADREREVYVALTRGRKSVTVLYDPAGENYMALNPAIQNLFNGITAKSYPNAAGITLQEA